MIEFAEPGIQGHVMEHIVHPAHVPFVVEAQAPVPTGLETMGQEVDSSAIIMVLG